MSPTTSIRGPPHAKTADSTQRYGRCRRRGRAPMKRRAALLMGLAAGATAAWTRVLAGQGEEAPSESLPGNECSARLGYKAPAPEGVDSDFAASFLGGR